jgi:hypothetical protein
LPSGRIAFLQGGGLSGKRDAAGLESSADPEYRPVEIAIPGYGSVAGCGGWTEVVATPTICGKCLRGLLLEFCFPAHLGRTIPLEESQDRGSTDRT